jgi:RNA polymerase sigma-70 factor (ECF subfamily)
MPERIENNGSGDHDGSLDPARDFETIVRQNSARIYNVLYQMTGNAQDTEELVQEVFYQAYKSLPRFKGEASVSTWLHRIAMNVACDFIRKKKRRPVVEEGMDFEEREAFGGIEQTGRSAETEFMQKESLSRLREAILKLPLKYRAPFVLNVVEGYSHEELAGILGITYGMARTRLHRALKMLRAQLGSQKA